MTIMTTILTMFIKDSKEMDLSDVVTALSPSRPAQVRPRRVRSRGEAARAHWATSRGGVAPLLLAVTRPVCAHCHGNEHSRALFGRRQASQLFGLYPTGEAVRGTDSTEFIAASRSIRPFGPRSLAQVRTHARTHVGWWWWWNSHPPRFLAAAHSGAFRARRRAVRTRHE